MSVRGNETLLSSSNILLFGRVLRDIEIQHREYDKNTKPKRSGKNNLLRTALFEGKDSCLARIFAYSIEGGYYELEAPAIFVVHGMGEDPEESRPYDQSEEPKYVAQGSSAYDKIGVANQYGHFAQDIRVWSYERTDFSIRFDMLSGMLEDILLGVEMESDMSSLEFGGGKVGGGKVGGGKVGGGKVGGGKVGGGKVGGGKVGGGKVGG